MDTDPSARGTTRQAKQEEYDALCKRVADNVPVDLAEYEELVQSYLEMGEEMGWRLSRFGDTTQELKDFVERDYKRTKDLRRQFMCNAGVLFDNGFDACVLPPLNLFGKLAWLYTPFAL